MERLRLFKLPRIIWRASHLKDKRADSVDCAQVLRINIKHAPEFLDRLAPKFLILLTWRAGNVLRSVCGSKIQPHIHQLRVQQFSALELNNGFIILAVLEDLDTLIECLACLSLIFRLRWCLLSRQSRCHQVAQKNQPHDHNPGTNTRREYTASEFVHGSPRLTCGQSHSTLGRLVGNLENAERQIAPEMILGPKT